MKNFRIRELKRGRALYASHELAKRLDRRGYGGRPTKTGKAYWFLTTPATRLRALAMEALARKD